MAEKKFNDLGIGDIIFSLSSRNNIVECFIQLELLCIKDITVFYYNDLRDKKQLGKIFHFTNGANLRFYKTELNRCDVIGHYSDHNIFYKRYKELIQDILLKLMERKEAYLTLYGFHPTYCIDPLIKVLDFHRAYKRTITTNHKVSSRIYADFHNSFNEVELLVLTPQTNRQ